MEKIKGVFGVWELVRYGLVSILAFSVDFAILILCTESLGMHYLASAAIGFTVGVMVAYVLSIKWAFRFRSYAHRGPELMVFIGIGVAGLGLNEFVMWNGTEVLGLHYLVSKMASAVLVFFFNFGLRKLLLFSDLNEVAMARK